MTPFLLTIITPEGRIFEDKIQALTVPAFEGSMGVLAHHEPTVARLNRGVVGIRGVSFERNYMISSGVLEVHEDGGVLVLADQATAGEEQSGSGTKGC